MSPLLYSTVQPVVLSLLPHGVRGSPTGFPAIGSEDQQRTVERIQILSPISLILVLLVLRLIEPRFVYLGLVAIPMLLSMGATLGIAGMITGKITILETIFGILIFGLGVDFALHLSSRMHEE